MSTPASPSPDLPVSTGLPARTRRFSRRWLVLLILIAGVVAGGAWRYHITRVDYRMERAREAIAAGQPKIARDYAAELESAGHPDEARLIRAESSLAVGSPDLALRELNQISPDGPNKALLAKLSGRALIDMGQLREAHRVFTLMATSNPDDVEAHRGLAVIAYDLGELSKALVHLKRVSELDPKDSRPSRLSGLINKDMSQDPDAEAAYREALRRGLPPEGEREVRQELGEVLVKLTKYADGLEVLNAIDAEGQADPAVVAAKADCLRGLGRQAQAAELLDRELATHPTAMLHRLRGQVHQELGQFPEAVRQLEKSVALDPNDHLSQYSLGQAYAGVGRAADATKAFSRVDALKKNLDRITALSGEAMARPWDARVRLQLAEVSEEMGKPKLAEMWRKAAAACTGAPPR